MHWQRMHPQHMHWHRMHQHRMHGRSMHRHHIINSGGTTRACINTTCIDAHCMPCTWHVYGMDCSSPRSMPHAGQVHCTNTHCTPHALHAASHALRQSHTHMHSHALHASTAPQMQRVMPHALHCTACVSMPTPHHTCCTPVLHCMHIAHAVYSRRSCHHYAPHRRCCRYIPVHLHISSLHTYQSAGIATHQKKVHPKNKEYKEMANDRVEDGSEDLQRDLEPEAVSRDCLPSRPYGRMLQHQYCDCNAWLPRKI